MRKANGNASDRLIERRLAETCMNARDRDRAAELMRDADAFAEAVVWVRDKVASLGDLLLRPDFKN